MPGDPALPARAWDFPPWQAARLVSGAAQEAARAWTQRVPAAVILDVTWDLQRAFRDLGITLWRLSRFQHVAGPDGSPRAGLHEPGSHIYRAGSATMDAGVVLRDREVLEHVRRTIARGRPVGGDPEQGPDAITAALELANAAAMAYRIVGTSPTGTATARDAAVGAFMHVVDNLDTAVENLARHAPGPHSARLAAAREGLEQAYADLREALICSAVDFQQPGSGRQVVAMREHYPVLPHRFLLVRDAPVNDAAMLAEASFPPGSAIDAVVQSAPHAAPSRPTLRAPYRLPFQPRPRGAHRRTT